MGPSNPTEDFHRFEQEFKSNMDKIQAELLDIAKESKQIQLELCTLELGLKQGAGSIVNKETTCNGDSNKTEDEK